MIMAKPVTVLSWVLVASAALVGAPAQSLERGAGGPGIVQLAERGDARAQTRLGIMLATGQGFPQNRVTAAYWFCRAAEQGDVDAQYFLGDSYDRAIGVPQNWILAHMWLNLSASRTIQREEREHRLRMRDAIAFKLSSHQIEEAQYLALTWIPKRER